MTGSVRGVGAIIVLAGLALPVVAQPPPAAVPPRQAGPTEDGYLLPNGWRITPVGPQVVLSDLPLNILPLPDGRRALVATNGYNVHELSLIDLVEARVVDREAAPQSWFGLVREAKRGRLWWSGGGAGSLHTYEVTENDLVPGPDFGSPPPPDPKAPAPKTPAKPGFRSGLAIAPEAGELYSLDINAATLTAVRLADDTVRATGPVGVRPYDVLVGPAGRFLYVSDWARSRVLVVRPADLLVTDQITVGEHPNQMALHPEDGRLFVACASSNCVSVIDTRRGVVTETVKTALFPQAPEGSTPDALAVSPDGKTLYVANADNNCIAVIDVAEPGRSQVRGFIPCGWYPTAVAVSLDGQRLLVGVGKGNRTGANLPSEEALKKVRAYRKEHPTDLPGEFWRELMRFPHVGTTLRGALSIIPVPDERQLAAYTDLVYRNCPYSDQLLTAVPTACTTAIPTKVGDPSPIRHVVYIIKENRTYDQVLGDLPQGNGDPALVLFGREITPNHHQLAEDFVLLDNLYCNGHVSADGHPWSTMAYTTDYIARNWALTYSRRAGVDLDDEAELSRSPSGYLWDACARQGLSYRSYGEMGMRVSQTDGLVRMEARTPGLVGHLCPTYGVPAAPGQRVRDTDRAEVFLREFQAFEAAGELPRFMVLSLGEDHTEGTRVGGPTPQACVASNDLALGRIVDALSHSKSWPTLAIFVIEDDAQNGADHVDAHRTVGLVISPYTRRKHVDHTMYQTVSMIRSIELILGLPPLSQYDAAATPMYASFTDQPNLEPYTHRPARIDLDARNGEKAYGAERSNRMDFSDYDRIDDFELNEILWRAIKGPEAPLPPAVRGAIAWRPAPAGAR